MEAAQTGGGGEPAGQPGRPARDPIGGMDDRDGEEEQQRSGCAVNLSFSFPDIGNNFPEPSIPDTEIGLQKLKDDILRTYKNH